MKPKIAKSKRPEAERAAEWYLREVCECVATRRAFRTAYAKVDFFASDVIGKREDGSHVYCQATAGGDEALRQRRRKLEKYPWHDTDDVILLQLTETPNPVHRGRKLWWFRLHEYVAGENGVREWRLCESAVAVPAEWFKAYREADA